MGVRWGGQVKTEAGASRKETNKNKDLKTLGDQGNWGDKKPRLRRELRDGGGPRNTRGVLKKGGQAMRL